jgi:hypothetical protein
MRIIALICDGVDSMGRTVEDVFVSGRSIEEIGNAVFEWLREEGIEVLEKRENFVKGRMGIPGGLGLTAPKYFEISFKSAENGGMVHTEGWIGVYGISEQNFSKTALLAGIPRRKGWKAMENLWNKLQAMSK